MDLKTLKSGLAAAAAEAKKLVANKNDGRSAFAAAIRSNLDHAGDLLTEHEKWIAENPAPAEKKTPAAPAA